MIPSPPRCPVCHTPVGYGLRSTRLLGHQARSVAGEWVDCPGPVVARRWAESREDHAARLAVIVSDELVAHVLTIAGGERYASRIRTPELVS